MSRLPPISTNAHSVSLYQLKLLIVLLVVSNVGLGVASFYLLRKVDRNYSELLNRSVPVLNDMQELTVRIVQAMRATNPVQIQGAVAESEMRAGGQKSLSQERVLRERILASEWVASASAERKELEIAAVDFTQIATEVLNKFIAGGTGEATQLRDARLRPAFDRYLFAVTRTSDVIESDSRQANSVATARTGNLSTVVLGIASWPLFLVSGVLLITAIFVLLLMVLFRGREMTDAS